MIHHLARAFAVRQHTVLANAGLAEPGHPARPATPAPVRPRPITPWGSPSRPNAAHASGKPAPRLRISADPLDARRTVITGRFAEVCAALDRLVLEQEAAA